MKRIGVLLTVAALLPAGAFGQRLSTQQFVVIGEGIAAGMADFALRQEYQKNSFPALMAQQMNTNFPQPLFEAPGVGNAPGFPELPIKLPGTQQGSVRVPFPPPLFIFNLSVPGMKLSEALTYRPQAPLVQKDTHQTLMNLTLGYPALIVGANKPLWSPVEYATLMRPTLIVVELGYSDVLEAAVTDSPTKLPDVATFRANMDTLLTRLKGTFAEMVVLTIPDPTDTAFFTSVTNATNFVGTPPSELQKIFRLKANDQLTPSGLMLVGNLILSGNVELITNPLFPGLASYFPGTVVSGTTVTAVRARVAALNTEITNAAKAANASVYDLNGLFSKVRQSGVTVGTQTLSANYLGGFYSLDGYYPGSTAQALIANDILTLLNTKYKKQFPLVNVATVASHDPAGLLRPALRAVPLPDSGTLAPAPDSTTADSTAAENTTSETTPEDPAQ
ncbi:MAG: hypothetical protein ABL995_00385 [Bryobacteraceae bacterium]